MPNPQTPKVTNKKHLAKLERERIQNQRIKIGSIVVIVLVIGVIGYGILDQKVLQGQRPVAEVNGEKITTNEFVALTKYYRYKLIQQYSQTYQFAQMFGSDQTYQSYFNSQLQQIQSTLSNNDSVGKTVMDQLVEDALIRQQAAKLGITVSAADVDKSMHDAFGYYPEGTPTAEPAATAFATSTLSPLQMELLATLTPTGTVVPTEIPTSTPTFTPTENITPTPSESITPSATPTEYTLEGYQTELKNYTDTLSKDAGLSESDLRKVFENNLYRTKVKEAIVADLKPEQEQVRARHILVDTEEEANQIEESLKQGENFIELAQRFSKDTSTKDSGGDLGWFSEGEMVKEFNDAAFKLNVGQISDPIKTDYGYHIIQVIGHEVRKLDASAFDTLKTNNFNDWLQTQKDNAKITTYDETWKAHVPTEPDLATYLANNQ